MKLVFGLQFIRKAALVPLFVQLAVALVFFGGFLPAAHASSSAGEINGEVALAYKKMLKNVPVAKALAPDAKGILIFPHIVKGGLIIGGQYGEGALMVNGKITKYYKTFSASYGLQIGATSFGYALFFMDQKSLDYLHKSKGWEVGVGPTVVVVDEGFGRSLSSSTVQKGIYAFFFGQKGLMAGLGVQGSKIEQFVPEAK